MGKSEGLLDEGHVMAVTIEETPIAVYRIDGQYYATHNICTHQTALLSDGFIEDGCIECPLHQGLFDIRTGKAKCAPLKEDLQTFLVKVEDGGVYVDISQSAAEHTEAVAESGAEIEALPVDDRNFVIVGGGQAAASAINTMRDQGYTGKIQVISEEWHPPYERPPLSKDVLLGRGGPDSCHLLTHERMKQLNVDFRGGVLADSLDVEAKTLQLSDESQINYDKLLIATGSRPRIPDIKGADLPHVYVLRNLDDAISLKRVLGKDRRVGVVGGGFIGLEVASVVAELGGEATVIEANPRLLSRVLHPFAAMRVHQAAERKGVKIITSARTLGIHSTANGLEIELDTGDSPEVDLIVIGIGAVPNVELAAAAGIQLENGIKVDASGLTSDAHVYAAGDVATWPGSPDGRRLESWQNAQEQAAVAARHMAGDESANYDVLPWFWSDQFGINIQMLGTPEADHQAIIDEQKGQPGAAYYIHDGEKLTGIVAFDAPVAIRDGRKWLAQGLSIDALKAWLESDRKSPAEAQHGLKPGQLIATSGVNDMNLNDYYVWPKEGLTKIPDWVYTDPAIHDLEVEKIFHADSWNYVALEAEIPNVGDYVRSYVGPTPVVVSRDEDGGINVFLNRCVHRAAEFARDLRGNVSEFVCPYHQWSYDLKGNLAGVPFRRGVDGKGGMPKDFKSCDHALTQLNVTTRGGVIFASFEEEMPSLEEYLGEEVLKEFDATFDGRKLTILGYYKNTLPGNWKLYHENLKDPYHATLLHTFLVTFGLLVAGNKSSMLSDPSGFHGVMASARGGNVDESTVKEMRAYRDDFKLEDAKFLEYVEEFDSPWTVTMSTIWPNLIVQRELNTLGVRQIVPNGPNEFVMNWTMFGFEGDSEEMTRHRLRQGNLMGPAGFLGMEDNEAMKFVQDGMKNSIPGDHFVALDPARETGTADTLISEATIRGMYKAWREKMGIA
ncbi:FAD-dependent oxidoreductase [Amphritea sp. HPY]|uniref:FAD-dependent oxidoreductase n=1 Tax=Amphritea sp. HPY TaxID=3421652 RepID=UPI003D7DD5C6